MANWGRLNSIVFDAEGNDPLACEVFASIEDCMGNVWRNQHGAMNTRALFVEILNIVETDMQRATRNV